MPDGQVGDGEVLQSDAKKGWADRNDVLSSPISCFSIALYYTKRPLVFHLLCYGIPFFFSVG